jgi:hypothetical protein
MSNGRNMSFSMQFISTVIQDYNEANCVMKFFIAEGVSSAVGEEILCNLYCSQFK